jgi:hypothetical protein
MEGYLPLFLLGLEFHVKEILDHIGFLFQNLCFEGLLLRFLSFLSLPFLIDIHPIVEGTYNVNFVLLYSVL